MKNKSAVVIFSGGLDSTTVLYYALNSGYNVHAISYEYGQKHIIEIQRAKKIIELNKNTQHIIVPISARLFTNSALTGHGIIPKDRHDINQEFIPVTYVPARNLIFLSIAAAYAESNDIHEIFIGINSQDYSGYPDCRNDFISSFETTVNLATKAGRSSNGISIKTPLADLNKKEIIQLGKDLHVPFHLTWSCYDPYTDSSDQQKPCNHCDSCLLRLKGFHDAGINESEIS
ncbi:MAG: 7-cyano-7-deazaguanine synthase QueC [Spirochaetia bacterium]|nr:7-cyano-7-deazaguanine synthase QueC [Spirochaetia bacterium]